MEERCGSCSSDGEAVPVALVRHHVTVPWRRNLTDGAFSFCPAPGCPVVYFSVDGETFTVEDVRQPPAYKTGSPGDLLCFCFHATAADTMAQPDPTPCIRERVRRQECACDVLNPAGSCCLGSIGRWRKEQGAAVTS